MDDGRLFKIGDRVRVRIDLKLGMYRGIEITPKMVALAGKVCTVTATFKTTNNHGYMYELNHDCTISQSKLYSRRDVLKFNVGDIVTVKDLKEKRYNGLTYTSDMRKLAGKQFKIVDLNNEFGYYVLHGAGALFNDIMLEVAEPQKNAPIRQLIITQYEKGGKVYSEFVDGEQQFKHSSDEDFYSCIGMAVNVFKMMDNF